jgi:deoxyribonuclease V
MKIYYEHPWNVTANEARQIQMQLRRRVDLTTKIQLHSIKTLAAADISYSRGDKYLSAAVILLSFPELKIISSFYATGAIRFPYIPGLLSFREAPVLMNIFKEIPDDFDVLLCDGQGIAHPRRFGIACHLGTLLNKPALGYAKSRLIGYYEEPAQYKGSFAGLYDGKEQIGVVLRTRAGVRPVFVSPGHQVDFDTAREIVLNCVTHYRIPEPLRSAHRQVNRLRLHNQNRFFCNDIN